MNNSVRTAPTSTTNITGFCHWMSGRSMTKDCLRALRAKGLEKSRCLSAFMSSVIGAAIFMAILHIACCGCARFSTAERNRPEVLCERAQCRDRQEQQRADDDDGSEQETTKGQRVVAHRSERSRRFLLASEEE